MVVSLKQMLDEAHRSVPKLSTKEAMNLIETGAAVPLDVRDEAEFRDKEKVPGAVNLPRAYIEFKADPESPRHDPFLERTKTYLIYCQTGGRAALAGKTLKDMGFTDVRLLGGISEWIEAGGPTEQ